VTFACKLAERPTRLKHRFVRLSLAVPPVRSGLAYVWCMTLLVLMGFVACEHSVGPPISLPVGAVAVSPASATVLAGQTVQLMATLSDASGGPLSQRVVMWASSNTAVAKANASGLVTSVSAGSATITATSEGKSGTASLIVIDRVTSGDQSILPPGPPPSLPQAGASAVDPIFGHRLIRLTDATLCPGGATHAYSYWAALNVDDTRLLADCDGVPTIFQVDLASGTVVSLGPAFQATPLWWEGTIWSRSSRTIAYGVYASTGNARLLAYDFGNQTYTILKDLHTDTRFTNVFGSSSYLWQLSADTAQKRFAATVKATSSGNELGAVVWDRTTDQIWTYALPSGQALDEVQVDHTGRYLVMKLDGRQWQVWRLTDPSPGPVMADGPGHSDNGDAVLFQGHGNGLTVRTLDPPGGAVQIFAAARVDGKTNPYADAHASVLAADGWVYFSTYTDASSGGPYAPWSLYSGAIYKLDYNQELLLRPQKRLPEVVRMGRTLLTRVSQIPTAPGQWYLDATNQLYVWNPNQADPRTSSMVVFDWRPIHEEIVRVSTDGSRLERLAHHYSHIGNEVTDYGTIPFGSVSYDGRYVVFNSNWGGGGRVDVYAVQVQP